MNSDVLLLAAQAFVDALGLPASEGTSDTPARVARMWQKELCSGLTFDAAECLSRTFPAGNYKGPVVVRDIPFYSTCEHHLLPFWGTATVGYVPDSRIVGLSKLARLVDGLARQPQTQEALTSRIVDALRLLSPDGIAVRLRAEHLCMSMRGIQARGAVTTTIHREGETICLDSP